MKKIAFTLVMASALMAAPAMANDIHQFNTHGRYNYYVGQNERNEVVVLDRQNVKQIQKSLREAGFHPGPVDGILGPQTRSALKSFQRANYLRGDGLINERTLKALDNPGTPKQTRVRYNPRFENRGYND